MQELVDAWLRRVQAVVWPPRCILCAAAGQFPDIDLCTGCAGDLRRNQIACISCAEPLGGDPSSTANHRLRCGACLRRSPQFDRTLCPFVYDYPLDHLIRGLKYQGLVANGRLLGQLLAAEIAALQLPVSPQMLIPVPLAPRRFRQRGYNQAIEVGRYLERLLRIELRTDILVRTRETLEQAGLARFARRRNIKGAFAIERPLHASHVAIIDDVITTGSTVNEIARVLKRAGVERIDVWAIARAAHTLNVKSSAMPTNTAMPK